MNFRFDKTRNTKTIFTPRSAPSSRVEIIKHYAFEPKTSKCDVESFPFVDVDIDVDVTLPNADGFDITEESFRATTNLNNFESDFVDSDCESLNKKVEDINKQLAELELDIQTNFYNPETKVGFGQQNISRRQTSIIGVRKQPKLIQKVENTKVNHKHESKGKFVDPSVAKIKNEIMEYRSAIKDKQFEDKIEKKLRKLNEQKEKNNLWDHLPACPLAVTLPEAVLKIHELQLTSER